MFSMSESLYACLIEFFGDWLNFRHWYDIRHHKTKLNWAHPVCFIRMGNFFHRSLSHLMRVPYFQIYSLNYQLALATNLRLTMFRQMLHLLETKVWAWAYLSQLLRSCEDQWWSPLDDKWLTMLYVFDVSLSSWCVDVGYGMEVDAREMKGQTKDSCWKIVVNDERE